MFLFRKVAIVGVGLIGGSVALELKKRRLAKVVVGISRHKETLRWATQHGIIDAGSLDIGILRDADCIILATSVGKIAGLSKKISRIIKKECIVTDVGSTKQEICRRLEKIFPNFIGSHPLAGSEKRGIRNARAGLFEDSLCILTPTTITKPFVLIKIKKMWNALGARVVVLSPSRHDEIVSRVSHLPHAVAFSLITSVPQGCLSFAAGGLKDTTRIAASDSELWADIFLSNRNNMRKAIDAFQKNLLAVRSAIVKKDSRKLRSFLVKAQKMRRSLGV